MANGIDGKDGKKLSWIVVGEKSAFTGFTPVYDTNGALISLRTEYGKAKAEADDKAAKKVAARRPAPPTNLRVVDDSHSIRLEVPQLPTQP